VELAMTNIVCKKKINKKQKISACKKRRKKETMKNSRHK
jgi:hypothetical protein